jgi:hypothetical protein
MYKRMYVAHMKTILSEFLQSGAYETLASQFQMLINTDAIADTNKFFTNTDFQNSMTTSVFVGSYYIPGIKTLMDDRAAFLPFSSILTGTPPDITGISVDNTSPTMNSTVTITATVNNYIPGGVYLSYRHLTSDKFTRILMYDDGGHNDGGPNDNVFGASININSPFTQYYIYAENVSDGKFSPERAEHEFYNILTNLPTAQPGEIVINELLPLNQTDTVDENGKNEDWIEFYNTTSSPLSMFGLYLTDDITNPTKFTFPENSFIPANGYLIVFADEDATTTSYIHCNFKLSANGETVMLSNQAGAVLDSISFGVPVADVSFGRCPNGTGPFQNLVSTTFNSMNCPVGIEENDLETNLAIFPNPANGQLQLRILKNNSGEMKLTVKNIQGELIYNGKIENETSINTISWAPGIYFVQCGKNVSKITLMH